MVAKHEQQDAIDNAMWDTSHCIVLDYTMLAYPCTTVPNVNFVMVPSQKGGFLLGTGWEPNRTDLVGRAAWLR